MIEYVKRVALDVSKYDNCIENSMQSRIYAFSWYLDCVADNWDVLVLDDYKAVMPLPWKRKHGIKYVTQPYFCQQLGVFSLDEIDENLTTQFIKTIPKKFLKIYLQFNSDTFLENSFDKRKNYILSLNDSYENLFKSFNKGRKHAVKNAEKHNLIIKTVSVDALIELQKENYNYSLNTEQIQRLKNLSQEIIKRNSAFILGVFDNDIFLGGGFFIKTKYRITYLFSSFNDTGKLKQAASFLISETIKKYEKTTTLLDFEGGSIKSIGSFFKSFGAQKEYYFLFKSCFLYKK